VEFYKPHPALSAWKVTEARSGFGHAAGWHYGSAHLFVTPNLADIRSPLLLQLHLQGADGTVEDCEVALDWTNEMPSMPTAAAMRRIVAMDPVSQARCFAS
jgi:hypothetical protein